MAFRYTEYEGKSNIPTLHECYKCKMIHETGVLAVFPHGIAKGFSHVQNIPRVNKSAEGLEKRVENSV